jgi:hypothetical protein
MASLVNPSNINGNFPIAGQDNDSQGFRDNFTNIRNNFTFIKSEVEDLQAKAILKSSLIGGVLDNNFLGSQLKNAQLKNYAETMYDWGTTSASIQLDLALGNVHKIYTSGPVQINSVIKNWPASLQYARILLYITISNTTHTLSIPNTITTDVSAIPGLKKVTGNFTINFIDADSYIYEFSSVDSGSTIFVRELTRGNHLFRDPNFYFDKIGAGLPSSTNPSGYEVPTLKLSWGNAYSLASTIDTTKGGTDSLSVRGAVTSYWAYNNASLASGDGNNDPALMQYPGFSVVRSRIDDQGAGSAITTSLANNVVSGDLIGGFNALGFANNYATTEGFYQLGAINFYANGSPVGGIGGNIVISTKRPGTDGLKAAITIDSKQNVTIAGNLDVQGTTTTIESQTLTIVDLNVVAGKGVATDAQANSAGFSIDGVYANLEYHSGGTTASLGGGRWYFNKALSVANAQASSNSTTGALVVQGGLGVGGNLNVGGVFGLTSVTEATSTTLAAFAVGGGIASAKNIIAGGSVYANALIESTGTGIGTLVVQGGVGITQRLNVSGNVILSSTTDTTGSTSGALIVQGGLNVAKSIIANTGPVIFGALTNSNSYVIGTTGTVYSGALQVPFGGIHVAKTIMAGDDTDQVTTRLIVNGPTNGALDAKLKPYGDTDFSKPTGAVWIGNAGAAVGATVSGSFVLGTSGSSSSLYIRTTKAAQGTPNTWVSSVNELTPYIPTNPGSGINYGSATILGGMNLFGDLYVGQPSVDNTATGATSGTGNIYISSGAPSTGISTGAIVIQRVRLASGVYSAGGMAMQGNLYAVGNVFLGGDGSGSPSSNVVAAATTSSTSSTTGALVVKGGLGVAGRINASTYVTFSASDAGTDGGGGNPTGALILSSGGAYINGVTAIKGNLVLTAGQDAVSTTNATLVLTGSGGLAVGGTSKLAGAVTISAGTPGASGSGALNISAGGASIAGNLFVQGVTQPINAVGASGVALLNADGTANFNTALATATDVTNLNFTAEANKTYKFEAILFHDTNATTNKSFMMTFGAGTCSWLVETNTSSSGALSSVAAYTTSAQSQAVSVSGASNTNQFARITGTFYHTAATNVKVQAISSAGTGTLVIRGSSFLKWTKLN